MNNVKVHQEVASAPDLIDFAWWEITGKCQLSCNHCYASSGPDGTHGVMSTTDWQRVITQTREAGASMGQFIGGEPTLHPDLPILVLHALDAGMEVEIYTNLVHVTPAMWETFRLPGVRLATSYYSDDPAEHQAITNRPTHRSTTKNIARVRELGIPLRAGVVGVLERQRTEQGTAVLEGLGVLDIGYDNLREVGRGTRGASSGAEQLCGNCGDRQVAISPSGEVWPCVFSRWLPVGNVRVDPLTEILGSPQFNAVVEELEEAFAPTTNCAPNLCNPKCGPTCSPACNPQGTRTPADRAVAAAPTMGPATQTRPCAILLGTVHLTSAAPRDEQD